MDFLLIIQDPKVEDRMIFVEIKCYSDGTLVLEFDKNLIVQE